MARFWHAFKTRVPKHPIYEDTRCSEEEHSGVLFTHPQLTRVEAWLAGQAIALEPGERIATGVCEKADCPFVAAFSGEVEYR